MIDTVTKGMVRVAQEGYDAFERAPYGPSHSRHGESFVRLRDDRPEWVHDAVYELHAGLLPDDWKYTKARDAFEAIVNAGEDGDLDRARAEFCDGAVDTYTGDRYEWLRSSLSRSAYVDEAAENGLSHGAGIADRIGAGQYMEAGEIFEVVCRAVESRAAEDAE
jgi:hypothetical protein